MLVAGVELTHYGPGIPADVHFRAQRRVLERLHGALADDELAQPGREASARHDARLRAQRPGLFPDAADLDVGVEAGAPLWQRRDDHELRRGDRLAVGVARHLRLAAD